MIRMSVPTALAMGVSADRIMPNTKTGSVWPPPIVKKVMTKSSSESAMAMSAAPMTVGRMIGSVTVKKARSGEAPRSRALSTTRKSKLRSRA